MPPWVKGTRGVDWTYAFYAGHDIDLIKSAAMLGGSTTPDLTTSMIEAGNSIDTIFTRADLYAEIDAGLDIDRIETDSGFDLELTTPPTETDGGREAVQTLQWIRIPESDAV